jgi:prevent-host-death family protein
MREAGIRELKQNASAVVAEAVAGEVVTITDRGRAVALLVPLPAGRLTALVDTGLARPARRPLSGLGPAPRRRADERALSGVLEEMRADDRA